MGESFMSAKIKIEEQYAKEKRSHDVVSGIVADAVIDRIRAGNLSMSSLKDIENLINMYDDSVKVEILSRAIIYVGMNTSKNNTNSDDDDFGRPNSGKKNKGRSEKLFRNGFDD